MKKVLSAFISILMFFSVNTMGNANDSGAPGISVAEFWMCKLNAGQTMNDVRKLTKIVEEYSESIDGKAGQWIFTPFSGDMTPGTFVLMTVWPDFEEMGKGFQGWFAEGAGDKGMAIFSKAATCWQRNFATIEEQFDTMD
ncbi:MAG: hypothetical protein CMQ40_03845 [Gammaproteobacteria bacterium]|nr:hypothetical protein [Gammaproteobacteria bacterium]|tara:strand:- start:182 stop:601 length:420 start_codon:yes stop_codon:yes gene_type:complete